MPKKVISLEVLEKIADLYDHGYRGSQISKFLNIPVSADCVGTYTRAIKKLRSGQPINLWEANHAVIFEYAKIHNLPEPKIAERKKKEEPEHVSLDQEPTPEDNDPIYGTIEGALKAMNRRLDDNLLLNNVNAIAVQLERLANEINHFNSTFERYLKGEYSHD